MDMYETQAHIHFHMNIEMYNFVGNAYENEYIHYH